MYATVQNVYLKINRGKKEKVSTSDGAYKGQYHRGAKEKMRARKIVQCFSSNWTGDI